MLSQRYSTACDYSPANLRDFKKLRKTVGCILFSSVSFSMLPASDEQADYLNLCRNFSTQVAILKSILYSRKLYLRLVLLNDQLS